MTIHASGPVARHAARRRLEASEHSRPTASAASFPVQGRSALAGGSASEPLPCVDEELKASIALLSRHKADYWSFPAATKRSDAHGYFQYPAMMVPSMQRSLLETIMSLQPIDSVFDPFAGSGTLVVEGSYAGLAVAAQDINPLAVLLCKTKASTAVGPERLVEQLSKITSSAFADRSRAVDAKFTNWSKWFQLPHAQQLSRYKRAIREVRHLWTRRFFWVALAETVRLTSNSRTSTYKLHIRASDDTPPKPFEVFSGIALRNIERYKEYHSEIAERMSQFGGHPGAIRVRLRDTRLRVPGQYDLLMTSPPYGDNASTVPYGQSAYLPLQWIDLEDIDKCATQDFLRSTHEIDSRSLGGNRPRGELKEVHKGLLERSPSLTRAFHVLRKAPRDRAARVLSFAADLERALVSSAQALRRNAYSVWTLGNRRVGGVEVPLNRIVRELLEAQGSSHILTLGRRIPVKRMAVRNSITATMRDESILIARMARDPSGANESVHQPPPIARGGQRGG